MPRNTTTEDRNNVRTDVPTRLRTYHFTDSYPRRPVSVLGPIPKSIARSEWTLTAGREGRRRHPREPVAEELDTGHVAPYASHPLRVIEGDVTKVGQHQPGRLG